MKVRILSLIACVALLSAACKKHAPTDLAKQVVFPRPASVTTGGDAFEFGKDTKVNVSGSADARRVAEYFAANMRPATGFELSVAEVQKAPSSGIYFEQTAGDSANTEAYQLVITPELVTVRASGAAGLFYGVQTIRQLLPDAIESESVQQGPWEVATGTVTDQPTYGFRGAMLDVARHFFTVDEVKQYIDQLSFYKMNILHLHLSDDQGWRIEIKSWPNLTTHGGTTQVGGGKGGFYSQEQYKDIVKYAADHFVTIIPEFDSPGHTNAALSSYPELNCSGKAPELYTGINVGFSTLCVKKDITYKFIDDVVKELAEITPGPYIHVGGDESHATKKEDYLIHVGKIQDIVLSHGKKMIGWEEISQSKLKPGVITQFWSNVEHGKAAASQGSKIIMSPAKKLYVDMKYDSTTKLGQKWAAYIEVDDAYNWDPATYAEGITKDNILGIESPLWTEKVTTMDEIEYMVFPRMVGYSEIAWSSGSRSWDDYKVRLAQHASRMTALGIDFYKSKKVPWIEPSK